MSGYWDSSDTILKRLALGFFHKKIPYAVNIIKYKYSHQTSGFPVLKINSFRKSNSNLCHLLQDPIAYVFSRIWSGVSRPDSDTGCNLYFISLYNFHRIIRIILNSLDTSTRLAAIVRSESGSGCVKNLKSLQVLLRISSSVRSGETCDALATDFFMMSDRNVMWSRGRGVL